MKTYHKLVRDKIPAIIRDQGKTCETEILNTADYEAALTAKLGEETAEFAESLETEELCDIEEVLLAILAHRGISREEFEKMRQEKADARGGFRDRICLLKVN